jgi:uncharacterized protein (DUF362 family)
MGFYSPFISHYENTGGQTMSKKINRREFIKKGSSAALGVGLALKSGLSLDKKALEESKVVEITHPEAVSDSRKVDKTIVREMLQQGMKALTGSQRPWAQFIKPGDRIGLKINTLGRPLLFTHHELIQAVTEELMDFGVKENNIIVWDRWEPHMKDCQFNFNTSGAGVRCYGTETFGKSLDRIDPGVVYESEYDDPGRREDDGTISRFSKIFTQECNKIINMAILKNHEYAGVTLCLKNLAFGLCNNNERFHGPEHIGPFISDFCAFPLVKKKIALHMIDGLEACYENGPVPRNPRVFFTPKTLWLGTDPVALDTIGFQVIEAKRKEKGLPPLNQTGRPTDHIELAAKKGVGINNLNRIKLEKINLAV